MLIVFKVRFIDLLIDSGSNFFIFGDSLIVGRVVEALEANVERYSFFGAEGTTIFTDYIDDVEILIIFPGKGDVDSRWKLLINAFQLFLEVFFSNCGRY